ncbi:MAG: DnaJ domain-containing protein [Actinoplanes sp.]
MPDDPGRFRDLDGHDAYEILGVPPSATRKEIGQARRERQRTAHPDHGGADDDLAKLINAAAGILLDDDLRQEYDRWRRGPATPPPVPGPGPGPAPTYGDPTVMPHMGQPPPQYYRSPGGQAGGGRSAALIVALVLGGLCLVFCLINLLVSTPR